jgi:MtN3 and saliva related transmembrane protein
MQLDLAELIGIVAGAIGSFAFAPQALKIIRDKSAEDVSTVTYVMVCVGAVLWLIYGLMRGSPAIIFWNFVAAALAGCVLVLKVHLRGRPTP